VTELRRVVVTFSADEMEISATYAHHDSICATRKRGQTAHPLFTGYFWTFRTSDFPTSTNAKFCQVFGNFGNALF
jgi:hypothetical protein